MLVFLNLKHLILKGYLGDGHVERVLTMGKRAV